MKLFSKKNSPNQTEKVIINDAELKAEIVGFHKGALSILAQERQELEKSLAIVNQYIEMHTIKRMYDYS